MDRRMGDGGMKGQTGRLMDGWLDEWMNRWTYRQIDGKLDRLYLNAWKTYRLRDCQNDG